MIQNATAVLALGLFISPLAAQAAEQTVALTVHNAGCVLCPPIIQSALQNVKGVKTVHVTQPDGMANVAATVTFDDAQTTQAALIQATTDRGYPADPVKTASK